MHAFIVGESLPKRRFPEITYHLLKPVPDFSHPLREIYFRRLEVLDDLGVDYAMTVDCFDVLCLQPLPPFEQLLAGAHVAASVEHLGSFPLMGQGYTSNFLNAGVVLWNVRGSQDIRREIVARGRTQFRTITDDQFCLNEVIQNKYFDRLRILPCQYNFRAEFKKGKYAFVDHLDGVVIYHNPHFVDEVKMLPPVRPRADLPPLVPDGRPLTPREQFWRRLRVRLSRKLRRYVRSAL